MFIRNRGSLATLFILWALTPGVLSQYGPCTAHDNGKYYDLSQLKSRSARFHFNGAEPKNLSIYLSSSKDVQITTDTGQVIYFNVCQNVKTEMWGLKDNIQPSDVGGFIRRAHGDFVFG
jgi:hypothetical protein